MLNKILITITMASACAITAAAQQPQTTRPQSPTQSESKSTAAQEQVTTLVGCVYREQDIPGRAPNIAERVGVGEDYILVTSNAPAGAAGSTAGDRDSTTARGSSQPGAVGTSGSTGPMYKLEDVDDDKLQALVGKRVEVVGRVDAEAGDSPAPAPGTTTSRTDRIIGRDRVDLSEVEVTSIKEVAGACPAAPASR